MQLIVTHIKSIMIVCGLLTCTMIYAAIAPQAALIALLGQSVEGALANAIVRNWGTVITLFGVALVYSAWRPVHRPLVLTLAVAGKLAFIVTLLALGPAFLLQQAVVTMVADGVMIGLFVTYLVAHKREQLQR